MKKQLKREICSLCQTSSLPFLPKPKVSRLLLYDWVTKIIVKNLSNSRLSNKCISLASTGIIVTTGLKSPKHAPDGN